MTRGSEALVAEFIETWRALEGHAWVARPGRDEVRRMVGAAVVSIMEDRRPKEHPRVVIWGTPELASLDLPDLVAEIGCECFSWPSADTGDVDDAAALRAVAASSVVGITTCSWAVAETGTVALYATPATGRLPSLLPTAHLALVRPSHIVKSVADGLRLMAAYAAKHGGLPSAVNLVSGPSRSADIEGDLAVGVHGPRRAAVVIGEW